MKRTRSETPEESTSKRSRPFFPDTVSFPTPEIVELTVIDTNNQQEFTVIVLKTMLRIQGGLLAHKLEQLENKQINRIEIKDSQPKNVLRHLRYIHNYIEPPPEMMFDWEDYRVSCILNHERWYQAHRQAFKTEFLQLINQPDANCLSRFWELYHLKKINSPLNFDPNLNPFLESTQKTKDGHIVWSLGSKTKKLCRKAYLTNIVYILDHLEPLEMAQIIQALELR